MVEKLPEHVGGVTDLNVNNLWDNIRVLKIRSFWPISVERSGPSCSVKEKPELNAPLLNSLSLIVASSTSKLAVERTNRLEYSHVHVTWAPELLWTLVPKCSGLVSTSADVDHVQSNDIFLMKKLIFRSPTLSVVFVQQNLAFQPTHLIRWLGQIWPWGLMVNILLRVLLPISYTCSHSTFS